MKNMHNLIAMGVIKSLPSEYGGCVFRSRLEARTAYYFDLLGIKWEYEPEGYALPCGNYAPDFFCTAIDKYGDPEDFYVEVKPSNKEFEAYEERLRQLCQVTQKPVYYLPGFLREDELGRIVNTATLFSPMTYEPTDHGYDEDFTRGTTEYTKYTTSITAYFTKSAFKKWGKPCIGEDCYDEFFEEDLDCINRAKFLKFDRAGRAMIQNRRLKNYGIGIYAR